MPDYVKAVVTKVKLGTFFFIETFYLCCYCIEACYSLRVNCYFNSVFTNFLLTLAIGCHFWGVTQCNMLDLNFRFSPLKQGLIIQLQCYGSTGKSRENLNLMLLTSPLNLLPPPTSVSKLVLELCTEHKAYQRSAINTYCVT